MNAAIENLKTNQRQLDADGSEVGVSRQALDETLALVERARVALRMFATALGLSALSAARRDAQNVLTDLK